MKLLRTIPWFTRLLVGLFLLAQFAGVVSSPRANALPLTATAVSHMDESAIGASKAHHHAQGHADHGMPCNPHDHGGNPADACCALHACFAGLMPAVAVATEPIAGEPLSASPNDLVDGAAGGRLDRPPRPLH